MKTIHLLTFILVPFFLSAQKMNKDLKEFISNAIVDFEKIEDGRKEALREIGDYILQPDSAANKKLLFICTHNSRRSHIAQIWLKTAAVYYGMENVQTFSGGTESTAFHPNAVAAMKRSGFDIKMMQSTDNPAYSVSNGLEDYFVRSKKYTDAQNPQEKFAAIMVCSDADKSCPIVSGAEERFSLPYDDPRHFDGTPSQDIEYDERVREIATEMLYVMDYVKGNLIAMTEQAK